MTDVTANLSLPYILPSQAQKHVTHNEALQRLDVVTQLTVVGTASLPPADPLEGDCWIVDSGASDAWLGQEGRIAIRQDAAWTFVEPREGWRAWNKSLQGLRVHDGSGWTSPFADDPLPRLGINTTVVSTGSILPNSAV